MVSAGRVDEEHVGLLAQVPDRRLEQRSLAEREQPGLVACRRDGADDGRVRLERGRRPAHVVGAAATGLGLGEADIAAADAEPSLREPGSPVRAGQRLLLKDQVLGSGGPAGCGNEVRGFVGQ
jgi:hypothetical protein